MIHSNPQNIQNAAAAAIERVLGVVGVPENLRRGARASYGLRYAVNALLVAYEKEHDRNAVPNAIKLLREAAMEYDNVEIM